MGSEKREEHYHGSTQECNMGEGKNRYEQPNHVQRVRTTRNQQGKLW